MATTFLIEVNNLLNRVGAIQGDASDLTSFTDSQHQPDIDVAVQAWNEVVRKLYSLGTFQGEVAEGTITLATDTREYATASDFEQLAGTDYTERVMINASENQVIREYPGGWEKMYANQPDPTDHTGQPSFFAINKTNSKFRVDKTPTSGENGRAFTYLYQKRIALTLITDTFPFSDTVVDQLLPAVAEVWRAERYGVQRNVAYASDSFKDAVKTLTQSTSRKHYGVRRRAYS